MINKIKFLFVILISNILSIIFKFNKLKGNRIIFNSIDNNRYNYNSRFLFEYILNNYKNSYDVKFIINDSKLRKRLNSEIGNYFITSYKLSDIITILNSKFWITSSITTPIEFLLFKNNKLKVIHLGHGIPLKNIVFAEKKISFLRWINRFLRVKNITHVLCYSENFKSIMQNIFKFKSISYIPLGQPRNDAIFRNQSKESIKDEIDNKLNINVKYNKAILYSPTWRPYATVKFFPFNNLKANELNDILYKNDTVLFLRKHPYFPCEIKEEFNNCSNIKWFNSEEFSDIDEYLIYFDKLITDYSSIFLDYLSLNRPLAFIPYDLGLYKKQVGFTGDELFCGKIIENDVDFIEFILSKQDDFIGKREEIIKLLGISPYNNCHEFYEYLKKL